MSKASREFFEQLKAGEQPSLAETIKDIGGQIWDGAKPMFDHGRSEAVAALFAGHADIMYMHGDQGVEQSQGQTIEALPQKEVDQGLEM